MYAYEKMTPKEIIDSFEKAIGRDLILPESIRTWYCLLTRRTSPRIEKVSTLGSLDMVFRQFKDACHSFDDCDDCKYHDKEFGTAECFKRFLEEEV